IFKLTPSHNLDKHVDQQLVIIGSLLFVAAEKDNVVPPGNDLFSPHNGLFAGTKNLFFDDDGDEKGGLFDDEPTIKARVTVVKTLQGTPAQRGTGTRAGLQHKGQAGTLDDREKSANAQSLFDEDDDDLFAFVTSGKKVGVGQANQGKSSALFLGEERDGDVSNKEHDVSAASLPALSERRSDKQARGMETTSKRLPAGATSLFGGESNALTSSISEILQKKQLSEKNEPTERGEPRAAVGEPKLFSLFDADDEDDDVSVYNVAQLGSRKNWWDLESGNY
uniref:Uncharacterized protein n=1 Tax=Eptatretus burgeri TaxID=7764 RepID=A0A8C4QXJ4_EPTBU